MFEILYLLIKKDIDKERIAFVSFDKNKIVDFLAKKDNEKGYCVSYDYRLDKIEISDVNNILDFNEIYLIIKRSGGFFASNKEVNLVGAWCEYERAWDKFSELIGMEMYILSYEIKRKQVKNFIIPDIDFVNIQQYEVKEEDNKFNQILKAMGKEIIYT